MFGFSLQKLLFTILVIAIVWYGFKMIARIQERRSEGDAASRRAPSRRRRRSGGAAAEAEEMVACALCGTFVPARNARSCGRDDCPWPG